MDLDEINNNILKSLSGRFNVPFTGQISAKLLHKINNKLSGNESSSKSSNLNLDLELESLQKIFQCLGINISHIDIEKVKENNELHTYLLLDFLNVLFEALLADNPDEFNQLLLSFRAKSQVHKSGSNAKLSKKSSKHHKRKRSGQLVESSAREGEKSGGSRDGEREYGGVGNGGGTTSGAEEVDRILREARKKYGKISSLKEKVEANISVIKKLPTDFSEVDNVDKYSSYKEIFSKYSSKENTVSSVQISSSRSDLSTTSKTTSTKSSIELESSLKIKSSTNYEKSSKISERYENKKSSKTKKTSSDNVVCTTDIMETTENEVNIRIPLEEASINVKVKSLDGKSLGNRRVHVRLHEEASPSPPTKKKRIEYGAKSVLYHHHRKTRPPLFSKKPEPPPLTDNQVLDAAVKIIKKRKHEENQSINNAQSKMAGGEMDSKRQKKSAIPSSKIVELETQKYLRDIRTRNGKLRRLAAELEN